MSNIIGMVIGSVASLITAAQQTDYTVKNTGTSTVYVGDTSVTPSSGRPITPDTSVTFTGGTSLYAITGAGTTTTVDVYDTAGNVIDPGSIAQQIFNMGVALPYFQTKIADYNNLDTISQPTFPYNNISVDTSRYTLLDVYYEWNSQSGAESYGAQQTLRVDFGDVTGGNIVKSLFYNVGPGGNFIQIPVYDELVSFSLLVSSPYNNPHYWLSVLATNGKQKYSCVNSGGAYLLESENGSWKFGSNDGVNPNYYNGDIPVVISGYNVGSVLNPCVVYEIPANTSGADVAYKFGIPNNGSGHMRFGFGFASNPTGTVSDEIRWNTDRNVAGVLLAGEWSQSLDNLFESVTSTNATNRNLYSDVYLPACPIRISHIHRNGAPACKLIFSWPNLPSF